MHSWRILQLQYTTRLPRQPTTPAHACSNWSPWSIAYLIVKPWHHHTYIHTHTAAISTVCTNTCPPSSSSMALCCRQCVGEARNSGDNITNYDRCYEAKIEWLKPEVSWVRLLATAGFFTFLYFHLITFKFIYFQREAKMVWVWPNCFGTRHLHMCEGQVLRLTRVVMIRRNRWIIHSRQGLFFTWRSSTTKKCGSESTRVSTHKRLLKGPLLSIRTSHVYERISPQKLGVFPIKVSHLLATKINDSVWYKFLDPQIKLFWF